MPRNFIAFLFRNAVTGKEVKSKIRGGAKNFSPRLDFITNILTNLFCLFACRALISPILVERTSVTARSV